MKNKERCIVCGRKMKFANGFNKLPKIKDILFVFEEMDIEYPKELNEVGVYLRNEQMENAVQMDSIIEKHGEPQDYNEDFYRENYPEFYYGYSTYHYIWPINSQTDLPSNCIGYSNIYGPYVYENFMKELLLKHYCSLNCFNKHLKIAKKEAKKYVYKQKIPNHQNQSISKLQDYDVYEELPISNIRKILIEEYGECRICGDDRVVEAHHIIARKNGGKDTLSNVIPLCPTCHKLAHGKGVIKNG